MVGAIINIILDPVFIFVFDMGVSGAALATVFSQVVASVWVLHFLMGKKIPIGVQRKYLHLNGRIVGDIFKLGMTNFVMSASNCLVQIACNSTLQRYGGDIYVGIMTVLNSVREIVMLPWMVLNGMLPVMRRWLHGESEERT
jgi:Na+-driven multidrug efflux pump